MIFYVIDLFEKFESRFLSAREVDTLDTLSMLSRMFNLCTIESVHIIVLILDDNSEHVARALEKKHLICHYSRSY